MTTTSAFRSRRSLLVGVLAVTACFAAAAPAAHAEPPIGSQCFVVPPKSVPVIGYTPGFERCVPWPGADEQ